jgi:hypothetical protein
MFTYQGKRYYWKGCTALVDDAEILLAIVHPNDEDKHGRLEITREGRKVLDLAVITALVMQDRSDENKRAVCPSDVFNLATIGQATGK